MPMRSHFPPSIPHLSNSFQVNKHLLSVNPAQGAMLGVWHNGKRSLLYFATSFIAYSGTMYSHGFFEKILFFRTDLGS